MSGKFMRIRKVVIPIITLIIITSSLAGCSIVSSDEMVDMINQGQQIVIELPAPAYEINIKGQQEKDKAWIQLDQLKSFNNGFRQGIDEVFNINIVNENSINGKSGVLYVDESGDRNGNTTLENALRNKVFVNKYWNNETVKSQLASLAEQAYTDVDKNSESAIMASINAYYNLLADNIDPYSFNGSMSLTREQFYTLVFKAEEGVKEIKPDASFEQAIGGATEYSKFAQEVDEYGFLSVANKSLDGSSYRGSISRAEAIYLIVNKHFPDELAKVTGKEQAFKDTKNAGDLALKVGFKQKKDGEIIGKDRWQSYTLAHMVQNPDKGMQEELYKAMVVAKQLGLITGEESRWDEPISKAEAIQLIINTNLAKNKLNGYLSTVEYGKLNITKFDVNTENGYAQQGVDDQGLAYGKDWAEVPEATVKIDPNEKLENGLTMAEAKELVKKTEAQWRKEGKPEDGIQASLKAWAESMGTTIETLEKVPDAPKVVEKPSKPVEKPASGVEKPASNSGSTSGSSSGSTSGDYEDLPDWMKEYAVDGSKGSVAPERYYESKDDIPAQYRDNAYYVEGKGWNFNPFK